MRIAYLIPEFPSQTHAFFWRERIALSNIGIKTYLVSTRRPPKANMSHAWASEAEDETFYLADIWFRDIVKISCAFLKFGPKAWIKALGAALDGCPPRDWPMNIGLLLLATRLAGFMKLKRVTHIHSHSCANSALIALFANRLAGITYSLTLHGDLGEYGRQQSVKWRHAAFAMTITNKLYNEVREQLSIDVPQRFAVVPMGVDVDVFKRKEDYEPWIGKGKLRLFSCGRLNYIKGHQDLIRAVAMLQRSGMNISLAIAGEDETGGNGFRQELERLISRLCQDKNITLLGAVAEARVFEALTTAHIFVLASHREPLGVAIMEALSCETPVIATNRGGVPELIDHDIDGYLVPPQAPKTLAKAIKCLALNPELVKRFSRAGRTKVAQRFNSNLSAQVLRRMLKDLNR